MSEPANVLVVAHQTAATAPLLEAVLERAARAPARVHLQWPSRPHALEGARAGLYRDEVIHAFEPDQGVLDVLGGESPRLSKESWALSDLTLLAPVPEPPAIYGIGLNYAKHVEETDNQPPEYPIVF